MAHKVTIASLGRTIDVGDNDTILEAALAEDINYPFGCHSGTCGSCKSKLLSGEVRYLDYSRFALTEEERAQGWILACSAVPISDCEVSFDAPAESESHPLRKIECRVTALASATHDIKYLTLEPCDGRPLEFSAGQFVNLGFGTLPGRDYSMANRPDEPQLVFHIRLTAGGVASGYVHRELKQGDTVTLRGPYGTSFLRKSHPGPVIALAGGSGLAPIKSIVETALRGGFDKPLFLYFGVRDERDLYLEAHFAALAARHRNLTFIPVLSQPSAATARRTGFLADAIAQDFATLAGWTAYLAGPPVMVESCKTVLQRLQVAPGDCHADAFYTEADRPAASPAFP